MTTSEPEPVTNAKQRAIASEAGPAGGDAETLYVGTVGSPDEYELVGAGRKGAEGLVFLARYQGNLPRAVPFAVKQLVAPPGADPAEWPDERAVQRWREQLKLLHLLRHPYLVGYRELLDGWPPHPAGTCWGDPPGGLRTWYLVMEWVEGPPRPRPVATRGRRRADDRHLAARRSRRVPPLRRRHRGHGHPAP